MQIKYQKEARVVWDTENIYFLLQMSSKNEVENKKKNEKMRKQENEREEGRRQRERRGRCDAMMWRVRRRSGEDVVA